MDNINVSPSNGFSAIYDTINTNIGNNTNSPIVLVILTMIIIIYFFIFNYLDVSVPTPQITDGSGISFLEMLMWGLIVFLVLVNGLQYFFKMDVKATINNLMGDTPEIDLKINKTNNSPEKDDGGDSNDIDSNDIDDNKTNVEKGIENIERAAGISKDLEEEVFHISDNTYTYQQAKAVCKAYKSKLANYSQIEKAYNDGGEWCGYGWSNGQMALFPTQKKSFDGLQKIKGHENDCGRPGINGGYMKNPKMRFGVNCFGKRPKITPEEQKILESSTPYPLTVEEKEFNKLVRYYKEKLPEMNISSFNYKNWSKI
jgi:hypothetical protein